MLFGTAVALRGSIVAIRLAQQTLTLSVDQTRLQDTATEIAGRPTPDGVMAAEDASAYRQSKRLISTLPPLMRRASRIAAVERAAGGDRLMHSAAAAPCFEFMK